MIANTDQGTCSTTYQARPLKDKKILYLWNSCSTTCNEEPILLIITHPNYQDYISSYS